MMVMMILDYMVSIEESFQKKITDYACPSLEKNPEYKLPQWSPHA